MIRRFGTDGLPIQSTVGITRGEDVDGEALKRRIQDLERNRPVDAEEYELNYSTSGQQLEVFHNLGPTVRWWVVGWRSATTAPLTDGFYRVWEALQEPGRLVLSTHASQAAGGIVTLRLEAL